MMKYIVGTLCSITLAGTVYMAGWGPQPVAHAGMMKGYVSASAPGDEFCTYCEAEAKHESEQQMLLMDVAATNPAMTAPASKAVDVGNTKCLVSGDAIGSMGGGKTVEYKGKIYHFCCEDCPPVFNKDPDKFVKLLEADPAKYGVPKK